jgi:hypothetical protein
MLVAFLFFISKLETRAHLIDDGNECVENIDEDAISRQQLRDNLPHAFPSTFSDVLVQSQLISALHLSTHARC